jgi:hypothetical protein
MVNVVGGDIVGSFLRDFEFPTQRVPGCPDLESNTNKGLDKKTKQKGLG